MTDRIDALLRLLQDEPNDTFCLYGLAQEYAKSGDMTKAIAYYDQTLTVDPEYLYAYYHKAVALRAQGDETGARQALETGIELARELDDDKAGGEMAELLNTL